jgi:hypothetical protein
VPDLAELADRLDAVAEDLADAALDRLRRNADAVRAGEEPDPGLVAEEKRITRARRSVEKAAGLLGGTGGGGFDEGP